MLLGIDGTVAAPRVREERGGDAGAFGLSSATDAQAVTERFMEQARKGCELVVVPTTWQVYNYSANE